VSQGLALAAVFVPLVGAGAARVLRAAAAGDNRMTRSAAALLAAAMKIDVV